MSAYRLINDKLLEVQLGSEQVYSKVGAMVAYQGTVNFSRSFLGGGGIQELAMRSATNEGMTLMSAKGTGLIYYAYFGQSLTIVPLQGETLYVESESVLVFDSRLRTGTMFQGNQGLVQGVMKGAMTGQGLFVTTLEGHGELAIISKGSAIALDVTPDKPIFVDPNAYIGHKGSLESKLITDVNWKTLIGKSSGESFQLRFSGNGTVYIQASERQQQQ